MRGGRELPRQKPVQAGERQVVPLDLVLHMISRPNLERDLAAAFPQNPGARAHVVLDRAQHRLRGMLLSAANGKEGKAPR